MLIHVRLTPEGAVSVPEGRAGMAFEVHDLEHVSETKYNAHIRDYRFPSGDNDYTEIVLNPSQYTFPVFDETEKNALGYIISCVADDMGGIVDEIKNDEEGYPTIEEANVITGMIIDLLVINKWNPSYIRELPLLEEFISKEE